jgi:hypothetical protein
MIKQRHSCFYHPSHLRNTFIGHPRVVALSADPLVQIEEKAGKFRSGGRVKRLLEVAAGPFIIVFLNLYRGR